MVQLPNGYMTPFAFGAKRLATTSESAIIRRWLGGTSHFEGRPLRKLNPTSKSRLAGLEVIRGLAALAVVLFHLNALYVPLPPSLMDAYVKSLSGAVPVFLR